MIPEKLKVGSKLVHVISNSSEYGQLTAYAAASTGLVKSKFGFNGVTSLESKAIVTTGSNTLVTIACKAMSKDALVLNIVGAMVKVVSKHGSTLTETLNYHEPKSVPSPNEIASTVTVYMPTKSESVL